MQKLLCKAKNASAKMCLRVKDIITNTDGDHITGWLIVVLLVVAVGAFFLSTYNNMQEGADIGTILHTEERYDE